MEQRDILIQLTIKRISDASNAVKRAIANTDVNLETGQEHQIQQ